MNTTGELTIYHCDKVTTLSEMLKKVAETFPGVPLENIEITFGIVSISFKIKK